MFAVQARAAILDLQRMASRTSDNYWLERIDRALDECVNNPDRSRPAAFQRRSALANARKIIDKRTEIRGFVSLDRHADSAAGAGGVESGYEVTEIMQWLDTTANISATDRRLMRLTAAGADAEALSLLYRVPVERMRERLSRARRATRQAWSLDTR